MTVTACSESHTGSSKPYGKPADSRPAEKRIENNIIKTPSRKPAPGLRLFDLTMAGLRAHLHSPAPSHSKKLQWHHAGVYRDLPLRAQLRICTGFPYSIALIYVFKGSRPSLCCQKGSDNLLQEDPAPGRILLLPCNMGPGCMRSYVS